MWTSDQCDGGFYVNPGAEYTSGEKVCSATTSKYNVRCCADTYSAVVKSEKSCSDLDDEFDYKDLSDVCGSSTMGGNCENSNKNIDWESAKEVCESAGSRLCSVSEIQAGGVRGTGCSYDSRNIWTSNVCSVNGTEGYYVTKGNPSHGTTAECYPKTSTSASIRCCADKEEGVCTLRGFIEMIESGLDDLEDLVSDADVPDIMGLSASFHIYSDTDTNSLTLTAEGHFFEWSFESKFTLSSSVTLSTIAESVVTDVLGAVVPIYEDIKDVLNDIKNGINSVIDNAKLSCTGDCAEDLADLYNDAKDYAAGFIGIYQSFIANVSSGISAVGDAFADASDGITLVQNKINQAEPYIEAAFSDGQTFLTTLRSYKTDLSNLKTSIDTVSDGFYELSNKLDTIANYELPFPTVRN